MYFYYIIRDNAPTYAVARKTPISNKAELHDKQARYIVPITFFQWIFMRLKFGSGEKR